MRWRPFTISIVEAFTDVSVLVAFVAIVIVAMNQAYEDRGLGPVMLDSYAPFSADGEWSFAQRLLFAPVLGITAGLIASLLLVAIRAFLPRRLQQRIVWLPSSARKPRSRNGEGQPGLKRDLSALYPLPPDEPQWGQYARQALLGIVLVPCTLVGLIAVIAVVHICFAARQQMLLVHLESLGARVTIEKSALSIEASRDRGITEFAEEAAGDLRALSRFDCVNLDLSGTRLSDADVEELGMVWRLSSLNLAGTDVTDRTLEQLKGSAALYELNLDGTKVTDAGLAHLKGVRRLSQLSLARTQITDTGLEHLKGLRHLCDLCLRDTRVSDKGLKHLRKLPKLRHLDVRGTRVTAQGTGSLQWGNLECEILK